jgi:DNA-binding NtrC family response regulator
MAQMGRRVTTTESNFIGTSEEMGRVESEIRDASRCDARVLITGESGVGKEIAARTIHRSSRNAHLPIVTINCAGIPDSLLESELFGHIRGSFTDAYRDRVGLLEQANGGGTVFLDEVGEMSPRMQALLLRFLENGEIQPVGAGGGPRTLANVRVISATNRDLWKSVESHDFRDDLYYRLNVIRIDIPPLRERREDIAGLLHYFLTHFSEQHRVAVPELAPETLARLVDYDWPGNVRQLKNVVERLTVRRRAGSIALEDLPVEIVGTPAAHDRTRRERRASPSVSVVESLFTLMTEQHEPFWTTVYSPFMSRDLTRSDLRQIVARGFQQAGNYKALAQLFNVAPGEYRRFLNFLRTHGCDVRFQLVGALSGRQFSGGAQPYAQAAERSYPSH